MSRFGKSVQRRLNRLVGHAPSELWASPVPLYDKSLNLGLMWTPKTGCTFAIKWFFAQVGVLEEANAYSGWVHKYRMEVYQGSEDFKASFPKILKKNARVLKVVRNPFQRAVSSFLVVLTWANKDSPWLLGYKDMVREAVTGGDAGMSFEAFIRYLELIDIHKCDTHWRLQAHPLELNDIRQPDYVIKLEESLDQFPRIEKELGLKASDLKQLAKSRHHHGYDKQTGFVGYGHLVYSPGKPFPYYKAFYNDELMERVAQIYREDFERYGYDPSRL